MAKSVLVWGGGKDFTNYINSLKYQQYLGAINIKAMTSRGINVSKYCGVDCISKMDIKPNEFDYVIVMSLSRNTKSSIISDAIEQGFRENQILMLYPFLDANFDMEKYEKIINNPPCIFSRNCWAARSYEKLGLKFTSPFINLYIKLDSDFLKLLNNPKYYLHNILNHHFPF